MSHNPKRYANDMMDEQWALIEPLIAVYKWDRSRELDMRSVVNAILDIDADGSVVTWYLELGTTMR